MATKDPNPTAGVRVPRQFHPLIKAIGQAIRDDPTVADRLQIFLRVENLARPGRESTDVPEQTDLFEQAGQDERDDDNTPNQPDDADTPQSPSEPDSDGQAAPPPDDPPGATQTSQAADAARCLEHIIAAITQESSRVTDTRTLVSTLRSEVEMLKAELLEVRRLRENLTDLRTRLSYAEYGLYDLGVQAGWRPEGSAKYRFKPADPDTADEEKSFLRLVGYASPVAAVTAIFHQIPDPQERNQVRIYDSQAERWVGSLAALLPPDGVSGSAAPEKTEPSTWARLKRAIKNARVTFF